MNEETPNTEETDEDRKRCWDCAYYHPHTEREQSWWEKMMGAKGTGKWITYANGKCHAQWQIMEKGPSWMAGRRFYYETHQSDPSCDDFVQKKNEEYP